MNKMMRLACLVSLLSLAVSASPLIAQDKLRVGLSSVSGLHAAVWVAETRGLFRKHGIDAEVIVTGQGGTAGISALIANDVQMVNSAGDVLVAASLRGGDTVMVASVINKGLQRLVTKPDIKTPVDLKGKRIGVTRIGAVSHSVLLMMLQRWKMNPNDVQVMQLGSSPNMLASLDKGGIEGAVLTIPSMFVAEDRGYRVLLDMADTDIYYLHTMVATTRHYVKTNRDKVLRFLKGYVEGHRVCETEPKREFGNSPKETSDRSRTRAKPRTLLGPDEHEILRAGSLSLSAWRRDGDGFHRKRQPEGQEEPIPSRLSTTACSGKSKRAAL